VEACNAAGCATSPPLSGAAPLADAVGYLKAHVPGEGDDFGSAVATCADGSTVAVGAWDEDSAADAIDGDPVDDSAGFAGAVYVFARDEAGDWAQQAYLKASNNGAGDTFGLAVAISADCQTLAVGAPNEDGDADGIAAPDTQDGLGASGAVYLFERDAAGLWSQAEYVKAFPAEEGAQFGGQVALSGDGGVLAVASRADDGDVSGVFLPNQVPDSEGALNAGAVWVYRRVAGWQPEVYLKGSQNSTSDQTGRSLALDGAGEWLAVGASSDASAGTSAGGVYLFHRGNAWREEAFVHPPTTDPFDQFGLSVALSADASTLVIGGLNEVYVYAHDGESWAPDRALTASNGGLDDDFGAAVAVSGDGSWVAVGAPAEDGAQEGVGGDGADDSLDSAGAVYLYSRDLNDDLVQRVIVKAPAPGDNDSFGIQLALSADGRTLTVGANREDGSAAGVNVGPAAADDLLTGAGAVYLY
jgi:FG-GAP repeat